MNYTQTLLADVKIHYSRSVMIPTPLIERIVAVWTEDVKYIYLCSWIML